MSPPALKRRRLGYFPAREERRSSTDAESPLEDGVEESKDLDEGMRVAAKATMEESEKSRVPRPRASPVPPMDTFTTDLLQMQIKELLNEVRPKYSTTMVKVEKALRKLKRVIEEIPLREMLSISEAEHDLDNNYQVAIPFPEPRPSNSSQYKVGYAKPANINVVGSYSLRTAVKGEKPLVVDLAVTMPSSLFQKKDYLNYRYFYKRAYYIACLAGGISQSGDCHYKVQYEYQDSDRLRPVLRVSPINDSGEDDFSSSKVQIRILLAVDRELFPMTKTLPWKILLRPKSAENACSTYPTSPTPFYNSSLRMESSVTSYLRLLHTTSTQCESFKEACMLWTVWLRQRGFGSDLRRGGFGSFESHLVLALLLAGGGPKGKPLLSPSYNHYQLFKGSLQFLASKDLMKETLIMHHEIDEGFRRFLPTTPLFFDGERGLNVLYKMPPWSYIRLRQQAQRTLDMLGITLFDRFGPSFITKVDDEVLQFDAIIRLDIPRSWNCNLETSYAQDPVLDFCTKAYDALAAGLGNRVNLIDVKIPPMPPWSLQGAGGPELGRGTVTVGLLVDSEHSTRSVDHGPPAEDRKAAAAFRRFWGEKAELRRFKDGRILESLIWSQNQGDQPILQQIITYVLARHLGREIADRIKFSMDDLHGMLPGHQSPAIHYLLPFQSSLDSFETLSKQIRGLEGLPLQVRQISAACEGLRYTSNLSPSHVSSSRSSRPMDILIQFEGSARWPDEIAAIQRTKVAFLLKLGERLEGAVPGTITRLGLENTTQSLLNSTFLDIITPENFSFRLRIHHDREITLLSRNLKTASTADVREATARAITSYKRVFLHSPTHTAAICKLATRFPLISPSIRLLKYWASCHLLTSHLSPELLEILTLRTFLHPAPWSVPGCLRTAFFRTLNLIAKWHWRSEPMIVDLGSEMTDKDVDIINTRLRAWRKIDPAINRTVLFVATNVDPEGLAWTKQGPSKVVAARLTALAQAACRLLKEQGVDSDVKALFRPSLADYDFVIYLTEKAKGASKEKMPVYKNLQGYVGKDVDMLGFDVVDRFMEELQAIYGTNLVLFCGDGEKSVIAGLWSPITEPRTWKVGLAYSTTSCGRSGEEVEEAAQVEINKIAILNNIVRLGGDLIADIKVKL